MDIIQRKYLESRLDSAARDKENNYKEEPKPQRVRDCEKVIDRWDRMKFRKRTRFMNKIRSFKRKMREIILFGESDKALKAIKDFEARKF